MPLRNKQQSMHEKLDKLAESLFETLAKLKTAAHAMAEHQASIEKQIQALESSEV
jgi:hypothetical protein